MNMSMTARFTFDEQDAVSCSCSYDGWTYVGGKNGVVYRTIDGVTYEEFWRLYSPTVSSLHAFGGALFVGTSPDGRVLMHNFSTGNRFVYVKTGDYSISSMCDDGDTMYVSTSPSGMILSFDGFVWNKIYESFTDISTLSPFMSGVYAFSADEGTVRVYSGGSWNFMRDGDEIFVVGEKPLVTAKAKMAGNPLKERGIGCSAVFGGKLYFSGYSRPVLYNYDGKEVAVAYRFDGGTITSIVSTETQLFVSVGPDLYVAQEVVDAGS
jgi:hypothetical protein